MRKMSKRNRNCQLQKSHKKLGKRGYGLVEVVIAVALLAILAVAVYSFYELMHTSANENIAAYDHLEDYGELKKGFCRWAAENDTDGTVFWIGADGSLTVSKMDAEGNVTETAAVRFSRGILALGADKHITGLEKIKSVSFSLSPDTDPAEDVTNEGSLIKCTVEGTGGEQSHFVFSLRCTRAEVAE